jgi:hypothetical protein
MRIESLLLVLALSAGSADAQTAAPAPSTTSSILAAAATAVADAATVADTAHEGAQTPAPAQAPQRPRQVERRRGSMVGYVDDAGIGSQVRIRFDAGFDGWRPDRAEFFYAKCGCYRGLADVLPASYDPNAPGPAPGVVTEYDFKQLYLESEVAVHPRVGLFVEVPVRWLEPSAFVPGTGSFGSTSGLGDIRTGIKLAVVQTGEATLTAQVRGDFPSGDAAKGLGTHHGTIVPALLYFQRLGERATLESQFGGHHPLSGSAGVPTASGDKFAGDVIYYGAGVAYEVYSSPAVRVAPVVEFVGWHVLGGFQTEIPGTLGVATPTEGFDIVNLKIGGRLTMQDRTSVYVGYGKKLSDLGWYNDVLRVELRYGF